VAKPTAQNQRDLIQRATNIMGAPSFSPLPPTNHF
jgi:hypothetical protein